MKKKYVIISIVFLIVVTSISVVVIAKMNLNKEAQKAENRLTEIYNNRNSNAEVSPKDLSDYAKDFNIIESGIKKTGITESDAFHNGMNNLFDSGIPAEIDGKMDILKTLDAIRGFFIPNVDGSSNFIAKMEVYKDPNDLNKKSYNLNAMQESTGFSNELMLVINNKLVSMGLSTSFNLSPDVIVGDWEVDYNNFGYGSKSVANLTIFDSGEFNIYIPESKDVGILYDDKNSLIKGQYEFERKSSSDSVLDDFYTLTLKLDNGSTVIGTGTLATIGDQLIINNVVFKRVGMLNDFKFTHIY
ncbi:MAG: hypothetical protein JJE18_01785 [Eubacteriaceae bacterium]|nr:hypothetical protein [Eubacteriaceae bacterium]